MRFDKACHLYTERLTSGLPFLELQIHARQRWPPCIETRKLASAGLTMIMYSSVDCVSGLYMTFKVTFFFMAEKR